MEVITSINNPRIKYLRKLTDNRQRKKEGKFILEGYRLIEEALRSGASIDTIFMTPEFADSREARDITEMITEQGLVIPVDERLFNRMADTINPQGIIAIAEEPVYDSSFLIDAELVLVLDRLQDPGNMGTMIRTALAAGVDGIICFKGSVDIYNLKVLRSTMGAIFNLPILTGVDMAYFRKITADFRVISADLSGQVYHYEPEYKAPVMLIIGNEAHGVRGELLELSNQIVKIPILGQIDSLNASVAGGIMLYEIALKKSLR